MRSQVIGEAEIGCAVVIADGIDEALDLNATAVFEAPGIFVIDNFDWDGDMDLLNATLLNRRKIQKESANVNPIPGDIRRELEKNAINVHDIVLRIFPQYHLVKSSSWGWRAMITENEFMHYDSWIHEFPVIMSFLNLSKEYRVYNLTYTFQALCERFPKDMRRILTRCRREDENVSRCLRERHWVKDRKPMAKDTPTVRVEFAPGSVWFFYPKTVCHQVAYGRGVLARSWDVTNSTVETQDDVANRVFGI